jgi:hypothetical protein
MIIGYNIQKQTIYIYRSVEIDVHLSNRHPILDVENTDWVLYPIFINL